MFGIGLGRLGRSLNGRAAYTSGAKLKTEEGFSLLLEDGFTLLME